MMDGWVQPLHPVESSPFVVDSASGVVNQHYPFGIIRISSLPHTPAVQVIFVAELDNKILVAFPGSAWHKQKNQRVLPNGWITRATSVEVAACSMVEREVVVEDLFLSCWIGFLKPDLANRVDFQQTALDVEYMFEASCEAVVVPFATAFADVCNDHFSFFSASEAPEAFPQGDTADDEDQFPSDPAGHGSAGVSARVAKLEGLMEKVSANLEILLDARPPRAPALRTSAKFSSAAPPPPRVTFAKAKSMGSAASDAASQYPQLDPGVVQAAVQAGVSATALQQMSKLVARNPKAAKMGDMVPPLEMDPLSEEEDAGEGATMGLEDSGSPEQPVDAVSQAVVKLTDLIASMAEEKKKKASVSKLDTALDGAPAGYISETSGLGSGKRSAAARRALRALLIESPQEISAMVEKLMWEDISSQTLGPNMVVPSFSVRAWCEHRSRIGSYRTLAHASWGVSGAYDCLLQGNVAACRARLAVLMVQLDQSAIDSGSWTLASELSLENGPPFAALEQHRPPNLAAGESPYSRILDPRVAEICLAHLREQEDFLSKRRGLGKSTTRKEGEEESESPRRRPKAKAKAKSSSETSA